MTRAFAPIVLVLLLVAACSGPNGAATPPAQPTASPTPEPAALEPASIIPDSASDQSTTASTPTPVPEALSTPADTPEPADTPTEDAPAEVEDATEPEQDESPGGAVAGTKPIPFGDGLPEAIDALLDGREGLYAVVVIGSDGEEVYSLAAADQIQAASLYKLLIMVEIYRRVDEGTISLDDRVYMHSGFFREAGFDDVFDPSYIGTSVAVEDLLGPMIMFSSNVAAWALLDLAGNMNINETVAGLGMSGSEIRWMPARAGSGDGLASYASLAFQTTVSADDAFNVTTAGDMALLFRLLLEGRAVDPEASEAMLDYLARQVVGDRLPALLPDGAVVAHKTGNIDDVIHDVGVIYTPDGPVVTVVLTQGAIEWEAVEFMRELALVVYRRGGG